MTITELAIKQIRAIAGPLFFSKGAFVQSITYMDYERLANATVTLESNIDSALNSGQSLQE